MSTELHVAEPADAAAAPETVDQPVLTALSMLAGLLERPISPRALVAGLPVEGETLSPELVRSRGPACRAFRPLAAASARSDLAAQSALSLAA